MSVDQTADAPIAELVRLGEERARARNRNFHGWGHLFVSDAEDSSTGVKVKESPKRNNPYHADIVLPKNADFATQKHVARRLARKARWERKPDLFPKPPDSPQRAGVDSSPPSEKGRLNDRQHESVEETSIKDC